MRRAALPLLSLGLALGLSALAGPAFARSACERYRAELSSLDRSASAASNLGAAAHRQRQEVQRLSGYYRSIGCDGSQFSLFGTRPECAALAQRIRAMESTSVQLATSSEAEGINARRRQLRAAISRECQPEEPRQAAAETPADPKAQSYRATGGPRLVCVRACDGYFFPLQNVPAKDSPSAMCRALCPNAETLVFHAPAEGAIEKAVSDSGKPYFRLANALRYQKTFDASCSCKKDGDSWASVLQRAERMLAQRKGDIVVTAKLSQELSRPRVVLSHLARARKAKAAEEARNAASPASAPDQAPTAGLAQKASFDPDATGTVKPEHAGAAGPESGSHAGEIGTSGNPRVISTSR